MPVVQIPIYRSVCYRNDSWLPLMRELSAKLTEGEKDTAIATTFISPSEPPNGDPPPSSEGGKGAVLDCSLFDKLEFEEQKIAFGIG